MRIVLCSLRDVDKAEIGGNVDGGQARLLRGRGYSPQALKHPQRPSTPTRSRFSMSRSKIRSSEVPVTPDNPHEQPGTGIERVDSLQQLTAPFCSIELATSAIAIAQEGHYHVV